MPLAANTTLGPYEIAALLGAGGMGEVYRARDIRHDRLVAVKVLSRKGSLPGGAERFFREIRIAAQRATWTSFRQTTFCVRWMNLSLTCERIQR
jgi:serine/threonine protein kinase